jgi:hypothetical protein
MPISRPDGLGEIANLGLTQAEAKLLLAQVQQPRRPATTRCFAQTVSRAAGGITRRVGGRIGSRPCSVRSG